MTTQLTPHFTLEELTTSSTAARLGIDNTPSAEALHNLTSLAKNLEFVRALMTFPMHIDSAYRCGALNKAVGGVPSSAHVLGHAADFVCPQFGTPLEIVQAIEKSGIAFDQLIFEQTWVHISFDPMMRHEVLTAHFGSGGRTSYVPGASA